MPMLIVDQDRRLWIGELMFSSLAWRAERSGVYMFVRFGGFLTDIIGYLLLVENAALTSLRWLPAGKKTAQVGLSCLAGLCWFKMVLPFLL